MFHNASQGAALPSPVAVAVTSAALGKVLLRQQLHRARR